MKQGSMSFQELGKKIDKFDSDRKWIGLDPSDLAKSIMIEGAELLEHFQWDNSLKNRGNKIADKNMKEIQKEVGDILSYLFKFCREMDIDMVKATLENIKRNEKKYPIDYRNSATDDDLNQEEYLKIKKRHRTTK